MAEIRSCKKCAEKKPLTTEFYNQLSTGGWRGVCKKCMAANTRRHYRKNPGKVKARVAAYNQQKISNGGFTSPEEELDIRNKLGDRCGYCGVALSGGGEFDHMMPVHRGGDSSALNMLLSCTECNRDKHGKTAEEFIEWRRRLGRPIRDDLW